MNSKGTIGQGGAGQQPAAQGVSIFGLPRQSAEAVLATMPPHVRAISENIDRQHIEHDHSSIGYVLAQPVLHPTALHGILKEITDAVCANSEAVPAAVAIHTLARFSATLGRSAYIEIGDQVRHLRINALIVGPTSRGRKGTSAEAPRQIFQRVEYALGAGLPLRTLTQLATGEGLIHQVRDPVHDKEGEVVDEGVLDKRLFCDISEFAGVLAQAKRNEATISMVLRDAFDGVVLTTPTKTSFCQATGAHIVVVGSIPETELAKILPQNEISNGLANRFAMFYSAREKLVASPEPTSRELLHYFAERIAAALRAAVSSGCIRMNADAESYWEKVYVYLNEQTFAPTVANLLARQDLYTRLFSALLALINGETTITCDHINAALAWMRYWEQTVEFTFSSSELSEATTQRKQVADMVVQAIAKLGGKDVTHTAVAEEVTGSYKKKFPKGHQVRAAVELLQRESPARIRVTTEKTPGRSVNRYTLIET